VKQGRYPSALLFACLLAGAVQAQQETPVVVSGTVPDEATRATLLESLRSLYGQARVVDQLAVGPVTAPAGWNTHVVGLINSNLKLVSRGQLAIDGSKVSLRGEVASEEQRQQVAGDIAARLNPSYTVNNGLRVAASRQAVLDAALADRIIEFETGSATLTESGTRILDQMHAAMQKLQGVKVAVIGHTDNAGSRTRNLVLSQARAESVKGYLVAKGVPAESVAVSGAGPDRPVADNRSPEGRARNRRIEFKVVQ